MKRKYLFRLVHFFYKPKTFHQFIFTKHFNDIYLRYFATYTNCACIKQYFFFLLTSFVYAQCPPDDVYLNSQTDVENYIANYGSCEVINGDLYLGGATDVSGITSIKRIEGSINTKASTVLSLTSFKNLEYVGGDFIIENNNMSINGLNKLHTVKGDFMIYNWRRSSLEGFDELTFVGGNFVISQNDYLASIPKFNKLTLVEGALGIGGNRRLLEIRGFNALKKIGLNYDANSGQGNLNIGGNEALTIVEGFNSLIEVSNSITFSWNGKLGAIKGFASLEKIDYKLHLWINSVLREIPTFDNLTTVGCEILLDGNGIQAINGFNNLKSIGYIHRKIWGGFTCFKSNLLTEINGFSSLSKIYGPVQIIDCLQLKSITGFYNLVEVGGSFGIGECPSLPSLNGLENLMDVGGQFEISYNQNLRDCSAICNLLGYGEIGGIIVIKENPAECSNKEEVEQECVPDFDKDGILDDDDLDDDNDGIVDTIEQNGDLNRDTDSDGFPDHQDLDSDNDGCFDVVEGGFTDHNFDGVLGDLPDDVNSDGLIINEIDGYTQPLDADNNNIPNFQEATLFSPGENGHLSVCSTDSPTNLFYSLKGKASAGGVWTPTLSSGTGLFDPSIDVSGTYTYIVDNGVCGQESAQVIVKVFDEPNAGESSVLNLCTIDAPVDLFSILEGNPDIGGTWSPSLFSGSSMFDPSVDVAGVYKYIIDYGACGNDTAEIDISVKAMPNSGENGLLEICIDSNSVNLFESLGGNPESGGVWSPQLASGSGLFDPRFDNSGIYTYTINNFCGQSTSQVNVNIFSTPNAGAGSALDICESSAPINLFESLNGTPDTGGTWSPNLSSGTGEFNPSIDPEGIYTYTVTNPICGSDSVEILVSVYPVSNAGEDGNLEICMSSDPVNLFDFLKGSPEPGGYWSPKLSSNSGIFHPSIDGAQIYTYSVDNGVCGTSMAHVDVTLINEEPIGDYKINITEFSENNGLEVIINSNSQYEYSLDGVNFQTNNTFENLNGGDYTIYINEINGCGTLTEDVTILTCPKYFTPNHDGYNDYWQLKGKTNKKYIVYIYNRYGKLLKTINSLSGLGWDGTVNGNSLPTDDYWFKILFDDGTLKQGHFTLKK